MNHEVKITIETILAYAMRSEVMIDLENAGITAEVTPTLSGIVIECSLDALPEASRVARETVIDFRSRS